MALPLRKLRSAMTSFIFRYLLTSSKPPLDSMDLNILMTSILAPPDFGTQMPTIESLNMQALRLCQKYTRALISHRLCRTLFRPQSNPSSSPVQKPPSLVSTYRIRLHQLPFVLRRIRIFMRNEGGDLRTRLRAPDSRATFALRRVVRWHHFATLHPRIGHLYNSNPSMPRILHNV